MRPASAPRTCLLVHRSHHTPKHPIGELSGHTFIPRTCCTCADTWPYASVPCTRCTCAFNTRVYMQFATHAVHIAVVFGVAGPAAAALPHLARANAVVYQGLMPLGAHNFVTQFFMEYFCNAADGARDGLLRQPSASKSVSHEIGLDEYRGGSHGARGARHSESSERTAERKSEQLVRSSARALDTLPVRTACGQYGAPWYEAITAAKISAAKRTHEPHAATCRRGRSREAPRCRACRRRACRGRAANCAAPARRRVRSVATSTRAAHSTSRRPP